MKKTSKPAVFFLCFLTLLSGPASTQQAPTVAPIHDLSPEETGYFLTLYQDSWRYLSTFVDQFTGLPYDSSARQPATSISNVGYYLASTAIAVQTGLIPYQEGLDRVQTVLAKLDLIRKWRGFPVSWFIARTLKVTHGREFSYMPHLSVLIGGLIVAKNTFSEIASDVERMFLEMQFKDIYDSENGWLKGGYNLKTKNFAIEQPWGHWYYKYFASDVRLLSFYMIARDLVPGDHWNLLSRPLEEEEGERFYVAGYEDSGMSVPFLTGLFLDERRTEMGESQRAYTRYQMKHAIRIGAPVWGWAFCETPRGRYLSYGEMKDRIVAPYASVLAAIYFPKEAYQNLKALESLGGRSPLKGQNFGFRDSVDWENKAVSENYLTASNGMVFLTLANLLFDGIVWNTFQKDPLVERGLQVLEFSNPPVTEEIPSFPQNALTLDSN